MDHKTLEAVTKHGEQLKALFRLPAEVDPVTLCRKLRRLEARGAAFALRLCNGPEFETEEAEDREAEAILAKVNTLLGNVHEYQPKTGAACGCKRGVQRDNCPACEGHGTGCGLPGDPQPEAADPRLPEPRPARLRPQDQERVDAGAPGIPAASGLGRLRDHRAGPDGG